MPRVFAPSSRATAKPFALNRVRRSEVVVSPDRFMDREVQNELMRPESSVQPDRSTIEYPSTVDLVGVPLALTDYAGTLEWMDALIRGDSRRYVCVCNVHTVMASQEDPELRAALHSSAFN